MSKSPAKPYSSHWRVINNSANVGENHKLQGTPENFWGTKWHRVTFLLMDRNQERQSAVWGL